MAKVSVLIEIRVKQPRAFEQYEAMSLDALSANRASEHLMEGITGQGITLKNDFAPIPLFNQIYNVNGLERFSVSEISKDMEAESLVVSAEVDSEKLNALRTQREKFIIWPNSEIRLIATDCPPYQPAVSIVDIRNALGVQPVFDAGYTGQGIVVGIVDEGVDGNTYRVTGGALNFGRAGISSHGSMCAAGVLVAAPDATLYDYPFLSNRNSGGVATMMQFILNQRRIDGTPHVVNNSYGYYIVPPRATSPDHEVWNMNHPAHRKVREVVASGATVFFAAGNCGGPCPAGNCHPSSKGPGISIHGSNSLAEVITVGAVNSARSRIGYSSQGPGMFERQKPDLASYSHFFGNFGPGRPAGGVGFDNGTSAAAPVAAGVAAVLMSALGPISPADMKQALLSSTVSKPSGDFDYDTGNGVIHAGHAYLALGALA